MRIKFVHSNDSNADYIIVYFKFQNE